MLPQTHSWIKFFRGDTPGPPLKAPPYPLQDFKALYKCCIIILLLLNQNVMSHVFFDDINTCIIVLHNNLYLYVSDGNILLMEEIMRHLGSEKVRICAYNASKFVSRPAPWWGS